MADKGRGIKDLERALRSAFPWKDVHVGAVQVHSRFEDRRFDAHASVGDLQLWIEQVSASSGARLLDAIALAHHEQASHPGEPLVLVSPYFSPAKQEMLRNANVPFVDFSGNAWLVAPGVHVDRRGFANQEREERDQRDVFSDKASLALRVLLMERDPIGVRQIADIVGSQDPEIRLTPGYVSKIVKELERRGYVARRDERIVLRHPGEVLNDWVVSYRKRRRVSARDYFLPSPDAESLMPGIAKALQSDGLDYVFAGHAGASLVDRYAQFDVADVYVKQLEPAHAVLVGMGAGVVERGGNVSLAIPYYRISAFYDSQVVRGSMRAASDIQLYLDLYDYPVRGREQAEHLYERRLRPYLDRDNKL